MVSFRLKLKTSFLVVFNASNHSGSVRFFILKIYRFFRLQSGRSPPSVLYIPTVKSHLHGQTDPASRLN